MVTVSHKGIDQNDKVTVEADTQEEALNKLLEIRGVTNISELEPAVIETRWC